MNEASDVANNAPAIILFCLWWAFLWALDILATPDAARKSKHTAAKFPKGRAPTVAEESSLARLCELDPKFSAESFLRGARRAYEVVLHAYAIDDSKTLRPLLSTEVLAAFAVACSERIERQATLELSFIGIDSAKIVNAATSADSMEVTVLFRALIVSAERSAAGDVISGDPTAVTATADLWTFSRSLSAGRGGWVLIATDEGSQLE
ncbi:Tim44/TimA family putative adaptor protein [Mesorhizobium sp. BAC0120]|uniref:Tim44/TimA family putative adaptor protein n=1 Tax=Mesorhizobium sp. BAC0120 TaxID=3090670 RepID=UPI00298BFF26|nr:Tim44/TimA family putative adaptor protein [Mesorhizobium sp. BAC0120]MDW6023354.1 Tim44/TimA family putative adaptor protein [Mesorhizobium sp. BAC0120]